MQIEFLRKEGVLFRVLSIIQSISMPRIVFFSRVFYLSADFTFRYLAKSSLDLIFCVKFFLTLKNLWKNCSFQNLVDDNPPEAKASTNFDVHFLHFSIVYHESLILCEIFGVTIRRNLSHVNTSSKRSCSAAIRSSIAMRRPLDIGFRQRALPYGWPTLTWTFVPPPRRGATS